MLQVKTCLPDPFGPVFSSRVLNLLSEWLLRLADPPKMDRNFLSDCGLIVSVSTG